jgi:acyl dehydratase
MPIGTVRAMSGLYYDEFQPGQMFRHAITRTVTETDNLLFTALTHNPQPLHLDAEFTKDTEFGQRLVNSIFTLGLMIGVSVGDTTLGTTIANLGMNDVRFAHPVFIGDTLRSESKVLEMRESKSRPDAGIVVFEHRCLNQRGEEVGYCKRSALMRKKSRQ